MRKTTMLVLGMILGGSVTFVASQPDMVGGAAIAANSDTYRQLNLFGDVFERVRADYVESPDDAKLIESAINGMLNGLDPHSSYLSPKSFRDMQVQTRGEFGGLGIEVTMEEGLVKVVSPIDDTPASRAGILPNDMITHLDDEPVMGLTLAEAVEKMRGRINTPIELTIVREGTAEPLKITVVRDTIRIRAVRWEQIEDIGYIRISQFNEQTYENLAGALAELETEIPADELKGYVIDLRNNPGGLLDQAIAVSDAFLDRGEIVSTRGRNADETQRYNARAGDLIKDKPVIVLINGGSASASEIVAGALQDHRRATILGSRSFGKGSVQTIIPLGSNGALRLTTARYYTPSGRSIQALGIVPDIEVEQPLPEEMREAGIEPRGEAALRGHLDSENGEEATGSSAYVPQNREEDEQLKFAFDLLRGVKMNSQFPPQQAEAVPN